MEATDRESKIPCRAKRGGGGGSGPLQTPRLTAPQTIKIYTDWANHYLEKAKFRRFIQDLQVDLADGVLLADVIEAVTSEKVRDLNRKPKNVTQMIDNINANLSFLAGLGVNVEGLTARDIRDGNLKAILGLFFSISRYKQQQKQSGGSTTSSGHAGSNSTSSNGVASMTSATHQNVASGIRAPNPNADSQSRLPSPFRPSGGQRLSTSSNKEAVSNIPTPATSALRKATNPERNRLSAGNIPQIQGLSGINSRAPSASSSRSTSPCAATQSFIPQPSTKILTRQPTADKHLTKSGVPCSPSPGVKGGVATSVTLRSNGHVSTSTVAANGTGLQNKNSMLDKLKFFNTKDKSEKGVSKRTSSSSGFSSAKSERSDSSNSICSESKGCSSSTTPTTTTSGDTRNSSPVQSTATSETSNTSPKLAVKSFARKTFGRTLAKETGKPTTPKVTKKGNQETPAVRLPAAKNAGNPVRQPAPEGDASRREKPADGGTDRQPAPDGANAGVRAQNAGEMLGLAAALQPDNPIKESKIATLVSKSVESQSQAGKKSGSKDNPSQMQSCGSQVAMGGGTNIPKPTAAVKGTSKVSKDDKRTATSASSAAESAKKSNKGLPGSKSANFKVGKSDGYSQVDFSQLIAESGATVVSSPSSSLLRGARTDRGRHETNPASVSIAMVSPMPSSTPCDPGGKPPKPVFSKTESSRSVPKSAPGDGSIRGKVETTFDSTDEVITRQTMVQPSSTKETTFSEEPEDIVVNIKPMQPILRASPYGYVRSLGSYSSARTLVPSLHVARLGLSSRHLFASHDPVYGGGGGSKRTGNGGPLMAGDYGSDVDSVDLSNGYMSDGDVLRGGGGRGDDLASGYMSEGGASLYARRTQNRLKETMATVREGVQRSAFIQEDRISPCHIRFGLDDSSSISSGLSDTIAEISTDDNLTGSSVGSDHTNPSGSLKRAPKEGSRAPSHYAAVAAAVDRSRKAAVAGDVHHAKITGSKAAGVRKSDSSQQTENSVFRHNSGSSSKKSSSEKEHSKGGIDFSSLSHSERSELLRRGKSDLESGRSDGHSVAGILRNKSGASEKLLNSSVSPKSKRKLLSGCAKGEGECGGRYPHSEGLFQSALNEKMDKGNSRSSRGGSAESQSSSKVNANAVESGRGKGQSGVRATAVLGSLAYATKRPNSTCSVSSTGSSSKSGGSRVNSKKSSSERLSELDAPTSATQLLEQALARNHAVGQVSAIPRPGSASGQSSGSVTLERGKGKGKMASNMQTLQELYGYDAPDVGYAPFSHSSLGRKHGSKQQQQQAYPYGSSTIPPPSKDFSTVISNPHASYRGGANSPRLSVSSRNEHEHQHPSPYSVTFSDTHSSGCGSPYSWLRRSPSNISSIASLPLPRNNNGALTAGSLTEAESLESLTSNASSIHAQIQHARANSLTHACLMLHQRHTNQSPRLARSNSIRSTKSEKMYPSMMQRSEDLDEYLSGPMSASVRSNPRNVSQPTSPTPETPGSGRYAYPMNLLHGGAHSATSSPSHGPSRASSTIPSYVGSLLSKIADKDDELHSSSLSLASIGSSLYSTPEEKHNHEIRKLRRELADAHDKVQTLTSQLSTNNSWPRSGGGASYSSRTSPGSGPSQDWQAHVVSAFEQSLSNMTNRLHALTQTAERKDSELNELRATIESLRKQSAEAGLTSANFSIASPSPGRLGRQQSINGNGGPEHRMSRQLSTDSMSSINSLSSACSAASHVSVASRKSSDTSSCGKKKKKKGWLRSSFSKAFSRSKKNRNGSVSDVEDLRQFQSDTSAPNSPLLNSPHLMNDVCIGGMKTSHSSSAIYDKDDDPAAPEAVVELRKQLREKDMVLTDIRLEALLSAHQLESLKDTVNKMRNEMLNLKHDNERLQRLVSSKSLTSSQSSLPVTDQLEQRLSISEMSAPSSTDIFLSDIVMERDGKRVTVSVFYGCHGDGGKNACSAKEVPSTNAEVTVGSIFVSSKTKWDVLDGLVRRCFKEYVLRVDPVSNLGLNAESVHSYRLGEVTISKESETPELLPCGYLIGDCLNVKITLKGTKQNSVDSLAFETLVPKSIVHRYVSLLTEHRRIILCGPSGTGKTYLAHKLAEFLVLRSGKQPTPGSIATFNVDHKSAKELRQYLSNVAEQCEGSNVSDLPSVIILDNLHHVGSLGEVFNGFLSAKYQKCPFIIGTMNQATCSTTNLQLHHNFRWVLCANHMEPVKGFLGRHLCRKLVEVETRMNSRNNDLVKIIDWMPKVWLQLNKFLETHSSSDVTIGPRLFLSCPIDAAASQVWFTDLWNYSVVPYLLEAVREGLQLYGRRAPWEDPTEWVIETYPWPSGTTSLDWPSLLRLRPEDVGYEGHPGPGGLGAKSTGSVQSDLEGDPLLNMLMRLQEAASYSSPHSNDSDTTSLDSHSSIHTDDALATGIESTL